MTSVFAIDPGPEVSSWVIWDGEVVHSGTISNEMVLTFASITDVDRVVLEMVASYGMAVGKEVFETVFWIGRFFERYAELNPERMFRREVKSHLCGSQKAKDSNIRQALIDRFGPPGTKKCPGVTYGLKGGEWQAFALAVTWMDRHTGTFPLALEHPAPQQAGAPF